MAEVYMKKTLSEMSLEELWQLFPIFLTEPRSCWKEWYCEESKRLKEKVPEAERISHIGSTAIMTIWAKPIVDILVEIPPTCHLTKIKPLIIEASYLCMAESRDRISFNKGYTEDGFAEKVFHLHLRSSGDCDELYFRDYLIKHPQVAKQYERLKLELWKKYEHDRDGYTEAKTDFIDKVTQTAKQELL